MRYDERKIHIMLGLMVGPTFKSLKSIFLFISWEHGVAIGKKYDQNYLFFMLLKFYHHLHPFSRLKVFFLKSMKLRAWTFFEMMANTNKLAKEFVNKKLLIFCRY